MNRMISIPAFIVALLPFVPGSALAQKTLCDSHEQTVWSCTGKKKIYSLCAPESGNVAATYLQYRAGTSTQTQFMFPHSRRPPAGIFKYRIHNTMAYVEFENMGYQYVIAESINGDATIEVTKGGKTISEVQCGRSTNTLTLTSVMSQFHAMGIKE